MPAKSGGLSGLVSTLRGGGRAELARGLLLLARPPLPGCAALAEAEGDERC